MIKRLFSHLSCAEDQQAVIDAGAALIVKCGQDRKVKVECLLINVTGLTPESIEDIAQASLIAVKAANKAGE